MSDVSLLDVARGVLAERFGVTVSSADSILQEVARRQSVAIAELASAIVESCTSDSAVLPRSLYAELDAA